MTAFHGGSGVPAVSAIRCDSVAPGEVEPGRDPVERLQRERDLGEIGVPGPLSHPVDRPLHPRRAGLDGSDRRSRGEPEVVVAVPVHRHVRPDPIDGARDEHRRGLGGRDPERVDDHELLRPCLRSGSVRLVEEREVGAGGVDPEERDADAVSVAKRTAERMRSSIFSRLTPSAASLPSEIGLSITDAWTPSSTSASTSACTARENPHTSARRPASAIIRTARKSSSDTRGNPASIRSIPAASSARAISSSAPA